MINSVIIKLQVLFSTQIKDVVELKIISELYGNKDNESLNYISRGSVQIV